MKEILYAALKFGGIIYAVPATLIVLVALVFPPRTQEVVAFFGILGVLLSVWLFASMFHFIGGLYGRDIHWFDGNLLWVTTLKIGCSAAVLLLVVSVAGNLITGASVAEKIVSSLVYAVLSGAFTAAGFYQYRSRYRFVGLSEQDLP